ncbi:MAG: hypothetical protein ACK4V0_03180 [Aphanizomenon sp.]
MAILGSAADFGLFCPLWLDFRRVDKPICLRSRLKWRSLTLKPNSSHRCFCNQFNV